MLRSACHLHDPVRPESQDWSRSLALQGAGTETKLRCLSDGAVSVGAEGKEGMCKEVYR